MLNYGSFQNALRKYGTMLAAEHKRILYTGLNISRMPIQQTVTPRAMAGSLLNILPLASKFGAVAMLATTGVQAAFKWQEDKKLRAEFEKSLFEWKPFKEQMDKAGGVYTKQLRSIYAKQGGKVREDIKRFEENIRSPWERAKGFFGFDATESMQRAKELKSTHEFMYAFLEKEGVPPKLASERAAGLVRKQVNKTDFYNELIRNDTIFSGMYSKALVEQGMESALETFLQVKPSRERIEREKSEFVKEMMEERRSAGEPEREVVERTYRKRHWPDFKHYAHAWGVTETELLGDAAARTYENLFPGKISGELKEYQWRKTKESIERALSIRKTQEEKADTTVGDPSLGYFIQLRRRSNDFLHELYHTRINLERNSD